jgi:hypothetical protein
MSDVVVPSLTQLAWQAPVLLVYLAGMILALVFWRRFPVPCLLMLIATVLLLVATLAERFIFNYIFSSKDVWGWDHENLAVILSAVGLTGNFLHAIGLGLLLTAGLVGRKSTQ